MSTWMIALIIGGACGLAVAALQHFRIRLGQNRYVLRSADRSVYGGHYRIVFGAGSLWTAVGFGIAFPMVALTRWLI